MLTETLQAKITIENTQLMEEGWGCQTFPTPILTQSFPAAIAMINQDKWGGGGSPSPIYQNKDIGCPDDLISVRSAWSIAENSLGNDYMLLTAKDLLRQ